MARLGGARAPLAAPRRLRRDEVQKGRTPAASAAFRNDLCEPDARPHGRESIRRLYLLFYEIKSSQYGLDG